MVTPERPIPIFIERCIEYIEATGEKGPAKGAGAGRHHQGGEGVGGTWVVPPREAQRWFLLEDVECG